MTEGCAHRDRPFPLTRSGRCSGAVALTAEGIPVQQIGVAHGPRVCRDFPPYSAAVEPSSFSFRCRAPCPELPTFSHARGRLLSLRHAQSSKDRDGSKYPLAPWTRIHHPGVFCEMPVSQTETRERRVSQPVGDAQLASAAVDECHVYYIYRNRDEIFKRNVVVAGQADRLCAIHAAPSARRGRTSSGDVFTMARFGANRAIRSLGPRYGFTAER